MTFHTSRTMSLTLDHLVVLVRDLEQTIADYTALGFNVQRGGTHADGATHNALIGFADGSYVELIAFLKAAPAHRWSPAHQSGAEGFVDYALLPSSVGEVVASARSHGVDYQGPFDGGRVRPDGERLVWQIGTPPSPDLPFLCGDITPRALRVREGEVRTHANGVRGVASVTLVVHELAVSLARYRALLGPQASSGSDIVALPGLGVQQATLRLGGTALVLVSPQPDRTDAAAARLRGLLTRRGEGLLGAALSTTRPTGLGELPLALTHGARFELVAA
jgi:catechol 2,3-dioxygenase-like lactoylglutathione lyase family enzyme